MLLKILQYRFLCRFLPKSDHFERESWSFLSVEITKVGKFGSDFFKNIGLGEEVLVLKCFDNMVCKMFKSNFKWALR